MNEIFILYVVKYGILFRDYKYDMLLNIIYIYWRKYKNL